MFQRFTADARAVVIYAQEECRQLQHRQIGTEHILLALLRPEVGVSVVLRDAGLVRSAVSAAIERIVSAGSRADSAPLSAADVEALRTLGIDADEVLRRGEAAVAATEPMAERRRRLFRRRRPAKPNGHIPFSPRAKKLLELSLKESLALRHSNIGAEHILLGLLREGEGLGARVIADADVDFEALRRATITALDEAA